jgi:hypothetical protein
MSNPKTAIQEIKKLMVQFGLLSAENFAEAKLVDGTVVKVEGDLVEGAAIKVVTEDAEIPAPDGVHELQDGTKVETKDGVIVKVEKVEESPVVEEAMEEVIETEVPSEVASVAEPVVEAIVEAILPVLEEVKDLAEEMKKMKVMMQSYKNDFEAFKKEPAGKKINSGKTDFYKEEKSDSVDARVASIMSMRKK